MNRCALWFCLLGSGLACAQNLTFSSEPTKLVPPALPACQSSPFSVTQTATYAWTTWCPGAISMTGGYVSGTGTGYCPGSTNNYCASTPGGSPAPAFQPQEVVSGKTFTVWVNVTSVSGPGGSNDPCGTPAITQGSSSDVPVPVCKPTSCAPGCPPSPILIDPTGEGFHLTDAAHGVVFREYPADAGVPMSWTDPRYGNSWLVRPNIDGSVTSLAINMFGNLSPQPPGEDRNGYRALAYWASKEGCGALDHLDAQNCAPVWSQLRLWTDANQDGVAQRNELHTLESLGVRSISLKYRESRRVDQYGNEFRYVASIEEAAGPKDNRCYDVFLLTGNLLDASKRP